MSHVVRLIKLLKSFLFLLINDLGPARLLSPKLWFATEGAARHMFGP